MQWIVRIAAAIVATLALALPVTGATTQAPQPIHADGSKIFAEAVSATQGIAALTRPATAAARCKGRSCTGKNPKVMGCGGDAQTIATKWPAGGGPKVQLRYSKKCRAAWARLASKTPSWAFMLDVKGGPNYTAYGSPFYRAYTKMAGRPLRFRACVKQWSSNAWSCTRWH
jgi:hypothetical protein